MEAGRRVVRKIQILLLPHARKAKHGLAPIVAKISDRRNRPGKWRLPIIDRYFIQELLPNYVFGLLTISFLMMLNELFYIVRYYFEYGIPLNQVMLLFLNEIPLVLSNTIPLAISPAYLLTLGRLSSESEVVAMKSCGIKPFRIIRAGLIFGVVIAVFDLIFMDQVVVNSNINYIRLRAKMLSQKPAVELKQMAFMDIGGYKISFDRMENYGFVEVLYNIHVIDVGGRRTIEAEKGRLFTDPENPEHYVLKFMNGSISEVMKVDSEAGKKPEEKFFVASFNYLTIHKIIPLPQEYFNKGPETMNAMELFRDVKEKSKRGLEQIDTQLKEKDRLNREIDRIRKTYGVEIKKLTPAEAKAKTQEMRQEIQRIRKSMDSLDRVVKEYRKNLPNMAQMKLFEKFTMPMVAIAFTILSLALGMFLPRSGRNEGLGLSILIIIAFYGFKIAVQNLIMKGIFTPYFEFLPFLTVLIAGVVLLIKRMRE